jgi:hypothetical protein
MFDKVFQIYRFINWGLRVFWIHTVDDSKKDVNGVTNTALKQFVSQTSNDGDGLLRSRQ